MSKVIKVTAILSIVFEVLYVLIGKIILPIAGLLFNSYYRYQIEETVKGAAIYYGLTLFGAIFFIIMLLYAIVMIAASKSRSENIAPEISGFIVTGALMPIVSVFGRTAINTVVFRIVQAVSSVEAFTIMNQYGSFLSVIHTIALCLLFISLSFSICRKKYASNEEFYEEANKEDNE
ncbi:MAG: hypothetical protein K6G75_09525 [Lachnospiraceae bacterium]|nr:hypothetical protein [Lachnospiraceae bacterium]